MRVGDVVLERMEFGEALSSETDFTYSGFDGVLGLGPAKVSSTGSSFLTELLARGLDDAVFSFSFSSPDKASLIVGEVQHDSYTGSMVWSKNISPERWQIQIPDIKVGTASICSSHCVLEFNTEIEVIVGPSKQVEHLYQQVNAHKIPGVTIRSVDCDKVDDFPDLIFSVKGVELKVTARDYVESTKVGSTEFCFLMVTSVEDDVDRWIMGTLAHQAIYVAYDFGRNQIGLAQAVHF